MIESSETPGHRRLARGSRGSEDAMTDDRQQAATIAPDDLIVRFNNNFILNCAAVYSF